jgi:internalin A
MYANKFSNRNEGMELRALRQLLDKVDEKQEWGGLKKVLTPEGHYLWLCNEHAEEYRK